MKHIHHQKNVWFSNTLLICLLFLSFFIKQSHASISVEAKPQRINYGDTFNFIITTDDKQSQMPNLKPLQQDFHIVGTERTMSYTVVNGQSQSIQQFILLLMPKKTGRIKIPSLNVGGDKTTAITIEVSDNHLKANQTDQTSASVTSDDTIMLKTAVNKNKFFVGEEIVYTVKLLNSGRLMDAAYQPPKVEDAVLITLGDADRYQTTEGGRTYVVEEQRYAIFPQKSGTLNIEGPSFKALVYDAVPRHVLLPSEKTSVQVDAAPTSFKGKTWFPAKKLILKDNYEQQQASIEQGETLTRTINIEAYGVPAQLIPDIQIKDTNDFNAYPEKPELKNSMVQNMLVGQSTIKVIYLMKQAGQVKIPALSVQWFNTEKGQEETATLPEKTFDVMPAAHQSTKTHHVNVSDATSTPNDTPQSATPLVESNGQAVQKTDDSHTPLAWILALIFGVAWILTLLVFWYRPLHVAGSKRRHAIKKLHEACINNDPKNARVHLLNWANLRWPDESFLDLNELSKKIGDNQLKKELQKLSKAIYDEHSKTKWHGSELWIALASYRRFKPRKKRKQGDLPPINP